MEAKLLERVDEVGLDPLGRKPVCRISSNQAVASIAAALSMSAREMPLKVQLLVRAMGSLRPAQIVRFAPCRGSPLIEVPLSREDLALLFAG